MQDGAFKTSKKRTHNFFKCILTKHTSLTSYKCFVYFISLPFFAFDYLHLPSFLAVSALFASTVNSPPLSNTSIWWMGLLLKSNSAKNDHRLRHPAIMSSTKPTGETAETRKQSAQRESYLVRLVKQAKLRSF